MKTLFKTYPCPSALILRFVLGGVMFGHGAQKMLGWFGGPGYEGAMGFLTGMGIPTVIAFLVIIGEFFGGLMLVFGLLTRVAAVSIGIVMIGAIMIVHWGNGLYGPGGFEIPLLILGACINLAITGGGMWSVDGLIAGEKKK